MEGIDAVFAGGFFIECTQVSGRILLYHPRRIKRCPSKITCCPGRNVIASVRLGAVNIQELILGNRLLSCGDRGGGPPLLVSDIGSWVTCNTGGSGCSSESWRVLIGPVM